MKLSRTWIALCALVLTTACADTRTDGVVTESDIMNAFPDPLPPGWSTSGPLYTGFSFASKTDGPCGGPNTLQIALDNGASAWVTSPWLKRTDLVLERWFLVEVYAFPSADSARAFVDLAPKVISECPSDENTVAESELDGFPDGKYDDAEWLNISNIEVAYSDRPEAQSSVLLTVKDAYSTSQDNVEYNFENTYYENYASYGSIVIVTVVHKDPVYADSDDDPGELEITPGDLQILDQIVSLLRRDLGV